jgi:hypothetical protein
MDINASWKKALRQEDKPLKAKKYEKRLSHLLGQPCTYKEGED